MTIKSLIEVEAALKSKSTEEILEALRTIKAHQAEELVKTLCRCAYHYDYRVREAAYIALSKVQVIDLAEVINDGLKDPRKEVFSAAAELYHREKKAA